MNPFFAPSALPYELPPFAEIRDEHFLPAFERGMADQLAEVSAISFNPEPPTFDNTLGALERSGRLLSRVSMVFFSKSAADTNDEIQEIESEIAPRLAEHNDAIHLDARLFERVEAVRAQDLGDPERQWLAERYHLDFIRAGAALPPADQERLRDINQELSSLSTEFQQNLLADTNAGTVVVDDPAELDGLSEEDVTAAAETAHARGLSGWALGLVSPTPQPALAWLTSRSLRERLLRAALVRGEDSNAPVALRIVRLRAERARLLGYDTHADYVIADQTAKTISDAMALLESVTPPAVANALAEGSELQKISDDSLESWDWAFYAEQLRKERFDIDAGDMRPYFEFDRVLRDGIFFAATRLYGVDFVERTDLQGHHPDVRVFEVLDGDGSPLGLFLADPFARESKRGGAWAIPLVKQSHLLGQKPVIVNCLNIPKPPEDEPVLLSYADVKTAFHEFGHALHGLFSDVTFPRFAGTSVPRDFVEYPSQVNEMWMTWPSILANYARHYETGEPMPQELADRMLAARQFNQGFATVEYLAAALLDLAWHGLTVEQVPGNVEFFEAAALHTAGVDVPAIPPRYRTTYFQHIFSSGYSAGYYSYIWSEVLDADTVEWFKENGGLERENGDLFRRELLSKGGSMDVMEAYRNFRGRGPEIGPLLERRGLTQD